MCINSIKLRKFTLRKKIRSHNYAIILLLLGVLYCSNTYCQTNPTKIKTITFDSSKFEVREPSAINQSQLLNNNDYKYDRVGPAPKTLWERFKDWFWGKVNELFNSKSGAIGFRIFKYMLVAAAIILMIILLLKNNVRALFYGKSAQLPIDFKEFEEDIHTINFNELINEALSEKDFRRAVRLHFLKLLKELTDKNFITWKIDKTNKDYSIELSNSKYNDHFQELATTYEYIWYGNFEMDEINFKTTIEKFKLFDI